MDFLKRIPPYGLIIGFSLMVHLPGITSPLLDYHAYRQTQTASMSRNYARHGMRFLNPELDTEGTPVRAGTEFPIYSYLIAIFFKLFGTHEMLGRLVSAVFAASGAVWLYLFVRRRLGEARALASALVMCALPIHVFFTRTVQPEPMALWGLLGFVYYFDRWLNPGTHEVQGAALYWWLAVFIGACAPLLKLPYLYVLGPLWAYLIWEKFGFRGARQVAAISAMAILLLMTWSWYHYAKTAPVSILPLTHQEHLDNLKPILSLKLWRSQFLSRLLELCLTYPGLLFAGAGVYSLYKERRQGFWLAWFGATALYIVLLGQYGLTHRYTLLPFAPVNAVLIASGFIWLWQSRPSWRKGLLILAIGIPIHAGFRIKHWYQWEYPWVFEARGVIAQLTRPSELIITNAREHPVLLYYLDRYGFSPELEETGLDVLTDYRARGARIFLTPTYESWARNPQWKPYFDREAELLYETPNYLIYRFR